MKKKITLLVGFCFFYSISLAVRIYVPGTYSTIQSAINHANNGDTIIVQQGTYYENINFKGKNIVLSSYYLLSSNYNDVLNTIIDGSIPLNQDTASIVLFINHEDSTAVLNGFTLKNGNGTIWLDEHNAGSYREGGAILCALSSPTITNNLIIYNNAINKQGIQSAGGGAIRAGDGNPTIINNLILFNKGLYGAGIVLNYCGAKVYNNIIAYNTGGNDYGGGGLWINNHNTFPIKVYNNTIVGNYSYLGGGGVRFYSSTSVTFKNNIVWANSAMSAPQIQGSSNVTYNDIEGGFIGRGNKNIYPIFKIDSLSLMSNSPCVDSGDSTIILNDIENTSSPGNALYPSLGSLRNDIGAFGGPYAKILIPFTGLDSLSMLSTINFNNTAPPDSTIYNFTIRNKGTRNATIDSIVFINNSNNQVSFKMQLPITIAPLNKDTIIFQWKPFQNQSLFATMLIYHQQPNLTNPFIVNLSGTNSIGVDEMKNILRKTKIIPNPSSGIFEIKFENNDLPKTILLMNCTGNIIKTIENTSILDSNILNLIFLSPGIYYLKIIYKDDSCETSKIIINS